MKLNVNKCCNQCSYFYYFFFFHFIKLIIFCKTNHSYLYINHHHHHTHLTIAKTTVKPHLRSLDNTVHSRNHTTRSCKEGEFQCESDGICIVGYKVCNNYNDCIDRSDEKYCDFEEEYTGNALFTLHKLTTLITRLFIL